MYNKWDAFVYFTMLWKDFFKIQLSGSVSDCVETLFRKSGGSAYPQIKFNSLYNFHKAESLTHVESDSDDVQRHSGVCDAAEWRRLDGRMIKSGIKQRTMMKKNLTC